MKAEDMGDCFLLPRKMTGPKFSGQIVTRDSLSLMICSQTDLQTRNLSAIICERANLPVPTTLKEKFRLPNCIRHILIPTREPRSWNRLRTC